MDSYTDQLIAVDTFWNLGVLRGSRPREGSI